MDWAKNQLKYIYVLILVFFFFFNVKQFKNAY